MIPDATIDGRSRPGQTVGSECPGEVIGLLDVECESGGLARNTGNDRDKIRRRYRRVNDAVLYEKQL
jgi:hypothetical protein